MAGITHEWNGTILTITSDSGTSSADLKGEKGDDGARGLTYVVSECVAEDSAKLGGVPAADYALKTDIVNQEGAVSREELEAALQGLATTESLNDYATKDYVEVELTEYATNAALNTALADYATKEYVEGKLTNLPTGDLDAHLADTNNPHGVSAEQIGAAAAADLEALAADVETHKNAENPHNITAAMIGAAKAGYGYGEQVINMGAMFEDETAFNTALDNVLSTMNNNETKQISFKITAVESITIGDWAWRGTLYKSSANYAVLSAESSIYKKAMVSKVKYNGEWQPWEWVNPPMKVGLEYRTTERYEAKPVYIKAVSLGTLPTSGEKSVNYTSAAVSKVVSLEAYALSTSGTLNQFPFYNSSGVFCGKVSATTRNIYIDAFADISANTGFAIIKYTKD